MPAACTSNNLKMSIHIFVKLDFKFFDKKNARFQKEKLVFGSNIEVT